jgi:hypothetical protein
MKQELISKIKDDLEKSGFSTEMQARKIFQNAGWSVNAGYGYLDKDEGKSREIDIIATKVKTSTHNGKAYIHSEFHICAEVKKTEKPWVVFDQQTNPALLSCAWNNLISTINLPAKSIKLVNALAQESLIKINGWVGSGIHESFKNPDQPSRWYSSFVSVAKASEFYLENSSPEGPKQTLDILKNPCEVHFVQPVVILNGPLFRADLTESGDIEITEIATAAFRFDYRSKNYNTEQFRVDLVTLNGLSEYLELVKNRQISFSSTIESESKLQINDDNNQ